MTLCAGMALATLGRLLCAAGNRSPNGCDKTVSVASCVISNNAVSPWRLLQPRSRDGRTPHLVPMPPNLLGRVTEYGSFVSTHTNAVGLL